MYKVAALALLGSGAISVLRQNITRSLEGTTISPEADSTLNHVFGSSSGARGGGWIGPKDTQTLSYIAASLLLSPFGLFSYATVRSTRNQHQSFKFDVLTERTVCEKPFD